MPFHRPHVLATCSFCCLIAFAGRLCGQNPGLEGYLDHAGFARQIAELKERKLAAVAELAKTEAGRDVYLLTLGAGQPDEKPAILIVGGVHAAHLAGSELALRVAKLLGEKAAQDEKVRALLDKYTLYVVPRASPDAAEKCLAGQPFWERVGNARKTDDDRDGEAGEDPPDDLNGDGLIAVVRVADDTGEYFPHPDDPRVLIKADPKKNERGQFRVVVEGRDNDGDGEFNEDAGDGVAFNRNFTFRYPFFERNAGPHQVSEPETRALADFAFDHPNIAVVLTFTPEDNLFHPWKPGDKPGPPTSVLGGDAAYLDFVAASYRKLHGGKDAPVSTSGAGSFCEWAYFHYGRWSLAARGWWVPPVAIADGEGAKKPSDEKRGSEDLNALRWFAEQKLDGFVPWTPVEHPDFAGKKVEVGGFRPFLRLNPPARELDPLAAKHVDFLVGLAELWPRLELRDAKAESLGGDVTRITVTVVNQGYLPTMPEIGELSKQASPLQIQLDLPPDTRWLQGTPRSRVDRLAGHGGKADRTWLVRLPEGKPAVGQIKVWAPSVGAAKTSVELKGGAK